VGVFCQLGPILFLVLCVGDDWTWERDWKEGGRG
jgi:hypothetical protein